MINVKGAVEVHKNHCFDLIRSSEQELTLILPISRTASNVNPLFGDFSRESDYTGTEKGPYKCIWHDALSARSVGPGTGYEPTRELVMGQYRNATAFAELWLEDVLQDISEPSGKTWFDEAKTVLYSGKYFQSLGEVRVGLATAAPYILLVVLKGGGNDEEQ